MSSKFKSGDHVYHPGGVDLSTRNAFPAGYGVVTQVTPLDSGDGFTCKVKCDQTKKVLPVDFEESELRPAT